MACSSSTRSCRRALNPLLHNSNTPRNATTTLPAFLVPAFAPSSKTSNQTSNFSTTQQCRSKIGRATLSLPSEVNLTISQAVARRQGKVSRGQTGPSVQIDGPLGNMSMSIPNYMSILPDETGRNYNLQILDAEERHQREMWGTVRANLANHILGVSEGHTAILRLVGVGYRATVEDSAITKSPAYPGQKFVSLKVGYSHPIELGLPKGVKASTPQPTRILLEGIEREVVMQFAAEIKAWRKPEPYKGKGIFVNGETIKLKAKKIK
ncbi:hypothetical protein MBLNU230_g3704t1 [Neophaeotheca triangularis]